MSLIEDAEPRLKNALRLFGWNEERCVPIEKWIQAIDRDARQDSIVDTLLPAFPTAIAFLEEFGGIYMYLRGFPSENKVFGITKVTFDPERAGLGSMGRVSTWAGVLGVKTYPIGQLDANQIVLAEDSAMYFDAEGDGKRIGRTIAESLTVMVFREKRTELLFPNLFLRDY